MPDTALTTPDPRGFGLRSFADILPAREPIVGEDAGSFDGFRLGMMASLAPATPYECVIAENLVAIEWELLQHRRMRDAGLRRLIAGAIGAAMVNRRRAEHEDALDAAYDAHFEAGGTDEDWKEPFQFDPDAAQAAGEALAAQAISRDPDVQARASARIVDLGMDPVEVMAAAYRTFEKSVVRHELRLPELEGRRRQVKADLDALQRARPVEAAVIAP